MLVEMYSFASSCSEPGWNMRALETHYHDGQTVVSVSENTPPKAKLGVLR